MTAARADQPSPSAPASATFADLGGAANQEPGSAGLEFLQDLVLPVSIEFGRTHMTIQDILELGRGSVIQLDRVAGEPVDIYVSDRKIGEGEVVVIGDQFGVRITRLVAPPPATRPRS
jgi:flagellar motor switch protein FliN/FliY